MKIRYSIAVCCLEDCERGGRWGWTVYAIVPGTPEGENPWRVAASGEACGREAALWEAYKAIAKDERMEVERAEQREEPVMSERTETLEEPVSVA